jgi:MFS family permease
VKWLVFAGFFNNVGIGYLLVYLTAFFPEVGVSPRVVGLILGVEGAMLFLSIPLGIRSDRRGRKSILLVGSTAILVPMVMMALTLSVPVFSRHGTR